MTMSAAEIEIAVRSQIDRLEQVVARLGGQIVHVKPHGALYNVAARDEDVARAIGVAVAGWSEQGVLFGLAGSACLAVWRAMGLTVAP
jgi:5-oxoprolinase (ATP-hydrolysing) subunit A